MTDKEKITTEIERIEVSCYRGFPNYYNLGRYDVCQYLKSFIDSLPEEPVSNDLEEASKFYAATNTEYFDSEGNPHVAPAFKKGAEWQKEQIINKVCKLLTKHHGFIVTEKDISDFRKMLEEK